MQFSISIWKKIVKNDVVSISVADSVLHYIEWPVWSVVMSYRSAFVELEKFLEIFFSQ